MNTGRENSAETKDYRFNKLLKLMRENPGLDVVPLVSRSVGKREDLYEIGKWGYAEVDEIYMERDDFSYGDRMYLRSEDEEVLVERYCNQIYDIEYPLVSHHNSLSEEEVRKIEERAMEVVNQIAWKKVIIVRIEAPRE